MKKKFTAIIAVMILLTTLCLVLTGCRKNTQNKGPEQTTSTQTAPAENMENMTQQPGEETTATENSEQEITESTQETWEIEVLESTPDKITMEFEDNKTGDKIQMQMGVGELDDAEDDVNVDNTSNNGNSATQPKPTEPKPTEPKPTEPKPTEPKPTQLGTGGTKVDEPGSDVTFADYESMSGQEQMLFYYSFADDDAFNVWYEAAKAAYDAGKNEIIIDGNGAVNIG